MSKKKFNLSDNTVLSDMTRKFQEDERTATNFLSPPNFDIEEDLNLDENNVNDTAIETEQELIVEDDDEQTSQPITQSEPSKKINESIVFETRQNREIKSKRINVLLPPTLLSKINTHVKELDISRNDFINQLLEFYFNHLEK